MTNSLFFLPFIIVPLCIITTAVLITYNNIRQVKEQSDSRKQAEQERQLETLDAQAEARRWLERLGSEVLTTDGIDPDSKNLIATAAQTTLDAAQTRRQAEIARDIAVEGLHLMRDARIMMGQPAGPDIPHYDETLCLPLTPTTDPTT